MALGLDQIFVPVKFYAIDDMSNTTTKIGRSIERFQMGFGEAMATVRSFTIVSDLFNSAARKMIATINASVKEFGDFEEQVLFIEKTLLGTKGLEKGIEKLSDDLLVLSGRIPTPAKQLAELGKIGSTLGLGFADLAKFVETGSKTMLTTGLTAKKTATLYGRLKAQFGFSASEFEKIGSAFVAVGNKSADFADSIVEATLKAGGTASTFGLSPASLIAMSASVTELGFRAQRAGTSISKLLTKMLLDSKGFAQAAGININQFALAMEKAKTDTNEAANVVAVWLKAMKDSNRPAEEQVAILKKLLGGNDVLKNITLGLINNADRVSEKMKLANKEYAKGNFLQKALSVTMKGLNARLQVLSNAWSRVKITMGNSVAPILAIFISGFTKLFNLISQTPKPVMRFITVIVFLASVLAILTSKVIILGLVWKSLFGIGASLLSAATLQLKIMATGFFSIVGAITSLVGSFVSLIAPLFTVSGLLSAISSVFAGIFTVAIPGMITIAYFASILSFALAPVIFLLMNASKISKEFMSYFRGSDSIVSVLGLKKAFVELGEALKELFFAIFSPFADAFGYSMKENSDLVSLVAKSLAIVAKILVALLIVVVKITTVFVKLGKVIVHTISSEVANIFNFVLGIMQAFFGVFEAIFSGDTTNFVSGIKRAGKALLDFLITPFKAFAKLVMSIFGEMSSFFSENDSNVNKILNKASQQQVSKANTNITIPAKNFGDGGIVKKPLFANIGERGETEVVAPLSKLKTFINSGDGISGGIGNKIDKLVSIMEQSSRRGQEIVIPVSINIDGETIKRAILRGDTLDSLNVGGHLEFGSFGVG